MSKFAYMHIIEFVLAQSEGRERFIVLTATVDRRAFKQLPHTRARARALSLIIVTRMKIFVFFLN